MKKGEFLGLIGANGSGKTTLVKLLTGIINPTSGNVNVLGYNPSDGKDEFKRKYAVVMGQKSQLWWDLPASDSLYLNKQIYNIPDKQYQETLSYFSEMFDVKKYLDVQVRKLSLGERMKLELIASLIHEPELLFLDEPTIGLDAVAQRQVREMLKQAGKDRGISVLLTSHYAEDLLDLTNRVMVIREGSKIYDGGLKDLLKEHSHHKMITVDYEGSVGDLSALSGKIVDRNDSRYIIKLKNEEMNTYIDQIFKAGKIKDISIEEEDISLLIERVYKNQ